ncbi:MAG TPA: BON domain-containing protein [Solirubrobacterales bacterium]|nr:BON domain-containing protein [Solirubrobacterales bacterium]
MAKVSRQAGRVQGRREAGKGSSPRFTLFLAGSGAGAAAEYLLDPQQGKRRRHVIRGWTLARLRGAVQMLGRQAKYMGGKGLGIAADATPPGRDSSELNDPALAAKVESELFRPADSPKGSVDVNVESGVVYLRGEVASQEQLRDLIERAQAVDGVARAESLLHLPGEPAPRRV